MTINMEQTETLPEGYELEQDSDGDWVLIPPADVTIFSIPGEGWLVTRDYMKGLNWDCKRDVIQACNKFLLNMISN